MKQIRRHDVQMSGGVNQELEGNKVAGVDLGSSAASEPTRDLH